MKKVVLAMVLAGCYSVSNAQQPPLPENLVSELPTSKNWLVYGDFGFNNQNNNNSNNGQTNNTTSWSVNPGIGYKLTNRLIIGVQGGISYNTTKITTTTTNIVTTTTGSSTVSSTISDKNTTDNWTLGIFIRHNCMDLGKTFYCFSQLNVSYLGIDQYPNSYYATSSYNTVTPDQVVNGYGFVASWFPALGVHLPYSYNLELNLGGINYSGLNQDHGNGTNYNLNFNFAQSIKIGVSKTFCCHRGDNMRRAMREPGDEMHSRTMEKMLNDDEDGGGRRDNKRVHDMDDE
jgi:hypothetical protein